MSNMSDKSTLASRVRLVKTISAMQSALLKLVDSTPEKNREAYIDSLNTAIDSLNEEVDALGRDLERAKNG